MELSPTFVLTPVLASVRDFLARPGIRHALIVGAPGTGKTFSHIAQVAQLRKGDFFSPDASLATPAEVKWAHEHNFHVAPYTVNTSEGWQKLADAHVDAIITDNPAGLLKWLRAQNPPLHP